MQLHVIAIGKTSAPHLQVGIDIYLQRLKHYARVQWTELPDVVSKNLSADAVKKKEGEKILQQLAQSDVLMLLDEKGKAYTSRAFADFLQRQMNTGIKTLCLVVGGAHGFSDEVYKRANGTISFSSMTFSHEMIRLFLAEQLYRAHTILKGEGYHHD
ncbi:MAG: 23S rRNA (pseudouridine(1915)-N(3))-methyltransferase RlmH [Flavobacteriales bacterium]